MSRGGLCRKSTRVQILGVRILAGADPPGADPSGADPSGADPRILGSSVEFAFYMSAKRVVSE